MQILHDRSIRRRIQLTVYSHARAPVTSYPMHYNGADLRDLLAAAMLDLEYESHCTSLSCSMKLNTLPGPP